MPLRKWADSANYAIEGILFAAKNERHLRYHLYAAVMALLLSYVLGVPRLEFLVILVAVILVMLAEMVNTAIEYLVDMVSPEYSEKARTAKDVSAGAVFITAVGSAVVGYIILFPHLEKAFESGVQIARHTAGEIALLSVITVSIAVVIIKSDLGKGHPLSGGMPSGHSALAFSLWLMLTLITESFSVSVIGLIMASLLAQSRIAVKAHTPLEVVMGALLGIGITLGCFLIFR
jgi:diacylglycerol kinase (ATP)